MSCIFSSSWTRFAKLSIVRKMSADQTNEFESPSTFKLYAFIVKTNWMLNTVTITLRLVVHYPRVVKTALSCRRETLNGGTLPWRQVWQLSLTQFSKVHWARRTWWIPFIVRYVSVVVEWRRFWHRSRLHEQNPPRNHISNRNYV